MTALGLMLVNFWTLLEVWALSIRRTLTFKSLLLFFSLGFSGIALVTFFIHFLSTRFIPAQMVSHTINPLVEEVVKILPLILLWLWYRPLTQKMSASDLMLLGLASGTGFEAAEALLYALGGSPRIYLASLWLPQQQFTQASYYFNAFNKIMTFGFAGHGIMAGAIGAAIGFAVLYYQPKYAKLLLALPLAIMIWAIYDHMMVNYLLDNSSLGSVNIRLSRISEVLYYFDRAGKLIVYAFTFSLFLGVFIEEIILSNSLANDFALRLPGEKKGYALVTEIGMVHANFSKGWNYLQKLLGIFLLRRQIAFYRFRMKNNPATAGLPEETQIAALLSAFRKEIQVLQNTEGHPETKAWDIGKLIASGRSVIDRKLKSLSLQGYGTILISAAWIVVFIFQPGSWRKMPWFHDSLIVLAVVAVIQSVITYVRFSKRAQPDLKQLDTNQATQFWAAKMLLNISLLLSVLGVAAYFVPLAKIINQWHSYFLWNAFTTFYNQWGWHMAGMLGINAGLMASLANWVLPGLQPGAAGSPAPTPTPGVNSQPGAQPAPTPTPEGTPTPPFLAALTAYKDAIVNAIRNPSHPEVIQENGQKEPHCNFFAEDVGSYLGINDLQRLTAAQQFQYVSNSAHWRQIKAEEAQRYANIGKFVIGATPEGADGHGHTTVVAPGYKAENSGLGKVPWVYDINSDNPEEAKKASECYLKDNPPRWYVYEKK